MAAPFATSCRLTGIIPHPTAQVINNIINQSWSLYQSQRYIPQCASGTVE